MIIENTKTINNNKTQKHILIIINQKTQKTNNYKNKTQTI